MKYRKLVQLLVISALVSTPASGIIIRHDTDDVKYYANPSHYSFVASVLDKRAVATLIDPCWLLTAGHVACVYGYDDIDHAIQKANGLPFAFQASVFTKKLDMAMKAIQDLDATAVMVNDHTAFRVDWMPFAGRRQSGYNTGGIGYKMHDLTQDKMAVIKI